MEEKAFDGLIQGMQEMLTMERGETVPGARIHDLKRNSATYAQRRQKAGWRRVAVWVPEDRVDDLRSFVDEIGKDRIPPKAGHHLDSRWKNAGGKPIK